MRLFELTKAPAKTKHVVMAYGRFNPPTIGHGKLIAKVKEVAGSDDYFIVPTKTQDAKKNPLTFEQKVHFMNEMFPDAKGHIALDPQIKTVFDLMMGLQLSGATSVTMVVGDDRVKQFESMLNSYNGKEAKHGTYNFESINIVSAGQRDPDGEGVEGMSASKMREAAANDDYEAFKQGLPQGYDGRELFQTVKQGMGLTESTANVDKERSRLQLIIQHIEAQKRLGLSANDIKKLRKAKLELKRLSEAEETCKTCGGEGVVYWDYDDPEVEATVKASAPCPDCSIQEDADNKEAEKYRKGSLAGKFIYSGWG